MVLRPPSGLWLIDECVIIMRSLKSAVVVALTSYALVHCVTDNIRSLLLLPSVSYTLAVEAATVIPSLDDSTEALPVATVCFVLPSLMAVDTAGGSDVAARLESVVVTSLPVGSCPLVGAELPVAKYDDNSVANAVPSPPDVIMVTDTGATAPDRKSVV